MRLEPRTFDDFHIPDEHLCDGCGYEPVFSADANCPTCVSIEAFAKFAAEINDALGTIDVFSKVINDALFELENEIYDDPSLDLETEKARIKAKVAEKIKSVLSEFGLE